MAFEMLTYKSIRSMIEELESQMRFSPRLIERCYREAFFEDLESILKKERVDPNKVLKEDQPFKTVIINNNQPVYRSKNHMLQRTLLVAASVAILLIASASILVMLNANSIETSIGEHKNTILPDGSQVTLNANSAIYFNSLLWHFDRHVELSGEALFHVKEGEKFTVNTNEGQVRVLGTVFNVRQRGDGFDVRCESGRVEVNKGDQFIILSKGENAKWQSDNGSLAKYEMKSPSIASWNEGLFYFDNEPLSQVVAEIERQFGINVILKTDRQYYFSGYFSNKALDTSVQTVCTALGLEYSLQKNGELEEVVIE